MLFTINYFVSYVAWIPYCTSNYRCKHGQVPIWTALKVAKSQVETFKKSLSSMLHIRKGSKWLVWIWSDWVCTPKRIQDMVSIYPLWTFHCVICPSIGGFCVPLWCLQTFECAVNNWYRRPLDSSFYEFIVVIYGLRMSSPLQSQYWFYNQYSADSAIQTLNHLYHRIGRYIWDIHLCKVQLLGTATSDKPHPCLL